MIEIAIPGTTGVVSGGQHPATCAATSSATVTMKTTASKSDVGHMALPQLRRDIAKEAGCDG